MTMLRYWKVAVGVLVGVVLGWGAAQHVEPAAPQAARGDAVPGLLARMDSGELHAGYGVYPPYTLEDPNTKKVSGFSVEVIEEIARQLNVKVVWHRINWNTMAVDLKRGEFEVIADPIYLTIPRAREFEFSRPYAAFADGIAVVRADESRIVDPEDLAKPGIRVVVGQGFAAEALVRARFPKADVRSIQVGNDLLQLFNEVVAGRADVAVNDAADAQRFAKEHPTQVKVLWVDRPLSFTPAGFALRKGDISGARFLDVALRNLEGAGVLKALADRYEVKTLLRQQD